ncbi:hypothetical protein HJG60_011165 [Phyllostomus discolor]|uniref:Uncharacterized protein n=1 Tax=Phyllostomus discolor TaxID=89673 RepID=A0A833ZX22_9CHIR|nr:hypothetical protein HJG60_011165 [Phyllostomus discolor]
MRRRLFIGRDQWAARGSGAARAGPRGARALLVRSPAWAAGVFKVGRTPQEPDIRESPAALRRRLLRSRPAPLRRPYNPRQCPETVWSPQPPRCSAPESSVAVGATFSYSFFLNFFLFEHPRK